MRALATLLLLVIVGGGGYYFGYRAGAGHAPAFALPGISSGGETGTTGSAPEATSDGNRIGKALSEVGSQATEFLSDAAVTTKIKSKLGLDDTMTKSTVHVSTSDGVVTLSGTVGSTVQRQRAMQLARETRGVKSVVDHLQVER